MLFSDLSPSKGSIPVQPILFALAACGVLAAGGFATAQSPGPKPPAAGAQSTPQTQPAEDPGVAHVNDSTIRLSDMLAAQASLPPQAREVPLPMIFQPLLDQLVERRLYAQAARAQKLMDDPEVKRMLVDLEERVLEQALKSRIVESEATVERLRARYDREVKGKPGPEEVRARHILVASEQESKEIASELSKGADFAEVARKRSGDGSARQGGDLGFFRAEQMVPEFSQQAFSLRPGQVSNPVKTQFGWHLIKVEERRSSKPPSFEEAAEELRTEVAREVLGKAAQELRAKAQVRTFNADGMPQIGPPGIRPLK